MQLVQRKDKSILVNITQSYKISPGVNTGTKTKNNHLLVVPGLCLNSMLFLLELALTSNLSIHTKIFNQ